MNTQAHLRRSILAAYGGGLYLYPAEFRECYAGELRHCAQEMLAESTSPLRTALLLAEDLLRSLLKEYFGMSLNRVPQLVILLTLTTFLRVLAVSRSKCCGCRPTIRIQLAEDAAQRLNTGEIRRKLCPIARWTWRPAWLHL